MDGRGFGGGDDGPAGCQVQLVYYVEGDPRFSVSPDALVIKGVRQYRRRVVKLWEEGRAPQVIFEVISRSTRQEDRGRKRRLYAELGVREYYMYDPTGDYLDPRLQAWMLAEDTANGPAYREMPLLTDEPGYLSPELGLEVRLRHDSSLGLRDPASGEWLEAIAEMHAARYGVEAALHEEKRHDSKPKRRLLPGLRPVPASNRKSLGCAYACWSARGSHGQGSRKRTRRPQVACGRCVPCHWDWLTGMSSRLRPDHGGPLRS